MSDIKCPKCGSDEIDWWIDSEGVWQWNCFECGHEWEAKEEQ